jgi:4-hydroxybenzoate polyprenyltransferase
MGVLWLACIGKTAAILAVLLALCIIVYDAIHKLFVLAPLLMAACRFLLILIASAAANDGIVGLSYWTALALASYIVGLSYLARKESAPGALQYWPCVLLGGPLLLALIINRGPFQKRGLILAGLVLLWVIRSLRFTYWSPQTNIGRSVSGLLAGIVLVDLLATGGLVPADNLTFAGLFLLALVFQRLVPAT